jgi:uncharacterized protein (DUF885 family)
VTSRPGILLALFLVAAPVAADDLSDLSRDFWTWRAANQPVSGDDVPRIERPADWTPDWTRAAVARRRAEVATFEGRLDRIDPSGMPRAWEVDRRLLKSAFARVRWELDVERGWERNPDFYVEQTLGALYDRLVAPPPFSKTRSAEIARRLASIPATIQSAKGNLVPAEAPFARLAMARLADIRARLSAALRALGPLLARESAADLEASGERAIAALEMYREWLGNRAPTLRGQSAVGRESYVFFLRNVALLPYTPEEILAMGRQEWARAVAKQTFEEARNAALPPLPLFPDQATQIAQVAQEDAGVRRFLEERNLLTVPAGIGRYRNLPMPSYLAALDGFGESDDLGSPDAVRYVPPPAPTLGYFDLASARDPRPILVHEGVPGHFFQLVLGRSQEDPVRRRYYDSSANEGLAFYAEEMMLDAGYFDDRPRTREIVASFMRLRALRVEADVQLALGNFSIDQAADYLSRTVPMDAASALEEAESFAAAPGQAISYQIGKLQIVRLLAEARRAQGEKFSLRAFHDFVWKNGNVPIALLRYEYLGLRDEINGLDHEPERRR